MKKIYGHPACLVHDANRIKDSKGFYVGVSDAKTENYANSILWTEPSDNSQAYILEKIK